MTELMPIATAGFYVKLDADGTPFLAFQASEGNIQVNLALARAENADVVVSNFEQQMRAAVKDLKRTSSRVVEAKGVILDGLSRNPQGRQQQGPRRKG